MDVPKPVWTTSSFLLYLGGLTVLSAATGSVGYLATQYGQVALVGWTLLMLGVLLFVALAFKRRGEWIAAGIFAVATVAMWVAFLGTVLRWWGWLGTTNRNGAFEGFNWGSWLLALLVIAAAHVVLKKFKFPLLIVFIIASAYYLVADIVSNGGSWSAVVTLAIGFAFLMVGTTLDRGPRRPYGFWYHVAAGLTIGGALFFWWHSSETDWALIATTGVVYVGIGGITRRSSWAVFGAIAFLAASSHWATEWANSGFSVFAPDRNWVPLLVFGIVGFFFVLLGLLVQRRRADLPAA